MKKLRATSDLERFIHRLSDFENPDKPFEHEYLILNESNYEQNYCEKKADNGECPYDCTDECCGLQDFRKTASRVLSAGNRIIDALIRENYMLLNGCVSCEPYEIDYSSRWADSEYADYSKEGFCGKCRLLDTDKCPEDILSLKCPRSHTAWGIERVTDAVNELL